MPLDTSGPAMPLPPEMEFRWRIEALERDQAAITEYLRATFMPADIQPDAHMQYLQARIAGAETGIEAREWHAQLMAHRQRIAEVRWEALFGVSPRGGAGGEGE